MDREQEQFATKIHVKLVTLVELVTHVASYRLRVTCLKGCAMCKAHGVMECWSIGVMFFIVLSFVIGYWSFVLVSSQWLMTNDNTF